MGRDKASAGAVCSLTSPIRSNSGGGRRLEPPLEFGLGTTTSTPLSGRKKGGSGGGSGGLQLSRQRSLDGETPSLSGGVTTPVRSKPTELFYRDGSLSRSLSFMQQRRPQTVKAFFFLLPVFLLLPLFALAPLSPLFTFLSLVSVVDVVVVDPLWPLLPL